MTSGPAWPMALALASLPCLFLVHWLLSLAVGGLRQRGVCLLAMAISAGISLLALALGGSITAGIYVFLVSAGIAYSYFHLFNMSLTARRIHLLIQQLAGRDQALAIEPYDASRIISLRLARMEQMGILQKIGDRLYVRSKIFLVAAWLLEKAHRLFYGKSPAL